MKRFIEPLKTVVYQPAPNKRPYKAIVLDVGHGYRSVSLAVNFHAHHERRPETHPEDEWTFVLCPAAHITDLWDDFVEAYHQRQEQLHDLEEEERQRQIPREQISHWLNKLKVEHHRTPTAFVLADDQMAALLRKVRKPKTKHDE